MASSFDLSILDGTNGFVIQGLDKKSKFGGALSSAGDVNGDGFIDIIIRAKNADADGTQDNSGKAYVIFGKNSSFAGFQLSDLDGSNGFVINGINSGDLAGTSVSSLDINSDGFSDLVIGANNADPNDNNNAGEVYVVFGKESGFDSNLNLSNLQGDNGFTLNGIDERDLAGFAVSNVGDVNNDNIDDLIISAPDADPNGNTDAGENYIIFGRENGTFPANLNLSELDVTDGFVINGIDSKDRSGVSVDGAGDINGDGIDDLIIGANFAAPNEKNSAGETYVVFGKGSNFDASLNLADLNGNNGFIIHGIDAGDGSGATVSGAGDVNGDGIADLIIGAPSVDRNGKDNVGEAYVVFGRDGGFASVLDLSTLNGHDGFTIYGVGVDDYLGTAVSGAGDVNGDRLDDILVSAVGSNNENGETHVIFGSTQRFPASIDLTDLHPNQGYAIQGSQEGGRSGEVVDGAGDVNDDGIDDILIGAPLVNVGELDGAGEAYVVFGRDERALDIDDYTHAAGGEVNTQEIKGIPIRINNVEGVSKIEFTFTFDPDLLEVTAFIPEGNFQTWESTVTEDTAGEVKITLSGDALTGSAAEVGLLGLEVPENAVYGSVNQIGLESVRFNNGDKDAIGDTATHLVAHLGDANGDGQLTAVDAATISYLAAGIDSEFEAYPGVDPLLVADLNGDSVISAFDASLVM